MKLSRTIVLIVLFCAMGTAAGSQTPATPSTTWATISARGIVSQQPPTPEWWTSFQDAVARSQTAVQLSQERYRSGLVDFLTVLVAECQLYNSEDLLAQSQIAVTRNLIALYKAPGAGWVVAAPGAPVQPNAAKP